MYTRTTSWDLCLSEQRIGLDTCQGRNIRKFCVLEIRDGKHSSILNPHSSVLAFSTGTGLSSSAGIAHEAATPTVFTRSLPIIDSITNFPHPYHLQYFLQAHHISQTLIPRQRKYGNDRTVFRPHIPQPPRYKTNEAISNPHRRPKKLPPTGCCMSLSPHFILSRQKAFHDPLSLCITVC